MYPDSRPLRPIAAAIIFLLPCLTGRAEAQMLDLRLRLVGGAFDPSGGVQNAPVLSSPTNVVSYDGLPTLALAGLGIDIRPAGLPFLLRASAARGFSREESGVWGCADADGSPLPCPSILILVPTEIGATQVVADMVVEASLGALTLRPIIGGAWSRVDYDWNPEPVGSFSLESGSYSDGSLALRYGAGISIPVESVQVEFERIWHRTDGDRRQTSRATTTSVAVSIPLGSIG